MPSVAMDSFERATFSAADIDEVAAFCAAHASPYDDRLVRMLLLELTSGPSGVFVIRDAAGTTLLATVVDRALSSTGAATLETLGVRAPLSPAAFVRLVVEPAVAFARTGAARALNVALPPAHLPASDAARALVDAGFSHAYDGFEMRRPVSARGPEPEPLPAGWSWAALDGARADEAHAALAEIFDGAPATNMTPLAHFRAGIISGAARWRVLLDGERIAGLVRAVPHGDHGELRIVGRLPAYRGRGLGPLLVAEGLRVLGQERDGDGCGPVDLHVEAANERALNLYRRFGFEVVARTPVFGLALRG